MKCKLKSLHDAQEKLFFFYGGVFRSRHSLRGEAATLSGATSAAADGANGL